MKRSRLRLDRLRLRVTGCQRNQQHDVRTFMLSGAVRVLEQLAEMQMQAQNRSARTRAASGGQQCFDSADTSCVTPT